MPDVGKKLYSPVGLPCVLYDEAAVAVELTRGDEISDEHGTLIVQPDGSMSDGPVYPGSEEEYMEVAATSEPAIGTDDEKDPFDDLPFTSVQAAFAVYVFLCMRNGGHSQNWANKVGTWLAECHGCRSR